eukprot:1668948-Prymnesium_polylepis.1
MVRLPVRMELSNVHAVTSYKPTLSTLNGAKTTKFPTAAAPLNFSPWLVPRETEASNVRPTT